MFQKAGHTHGSERLRRKLRWPTETHDLDVGFVSLTEALDLTTPSGRAMAGLLAVFADLMRSLHERAVRVWPTPGRTPNVWGDRKPQRSKPAKYGNYQSRRIHWR